MKNRISKIILSFLIFVLTGTISVVSAQETNVSEETLNTPEQRPPRIGVVPFDNKSGQGGSDFTYSLCVQFSTALVNCGRFEVYDRTMLGKILNEQFDGITGVIDPATAVEVGKITGLQLLACGTIMDAKCEVSSSRNKNGEVFYTTDAAVTVNYVVMDAETGAIWQQKTITESKSESGLPDKTSMIKQVAFSTVSGIIPILQPHLVGKVALVDVEKRQFVVNLGSLNGVSNGTYFEVITKGDPIYDPDDSTKIIGYVEGEKINARVISIQPNMCYAQPGFWRNVTNWSHPFGTWEWREEVDKNYFIDRIEVGMEVRTVDEPEYH